jgi:two-component system response regulator
MGSQPPVVLVADDDENDTFLLRHAFEVARVSCRLEVVRNGQQAVEYLKGEGPYGDRSAHPWPALMLLDLKMPVMGGFEVLSWWQQHQQKGRLPIVVMSSSNHEADIERAMGLGAAAYQVKPGSFDYLLEVARALGERWLTPQEAGC